MGKSYLAIPIAKILFVCSWVHLWRMMRGLGLDGSEKLPVKLVKQWKGLDEK